MRLVGFVSQMLRKSAAARPTLARCVEVITAISNEAPKQAHPALVAASAHVAAESATADAAARAAESRARDRKALTEEAVASLADIKARLFSEILRASEEASVSNNSLRFGKGTLKVGEPQMMLAQSNGKPNRPRSGWDVCAHCTISVERDARPAGNIPVSPSEGIPRIIIYDPPYIWSSTLVFASTPTDQTYRWREVSFWRMSISAHQNEPFGVAANDGEFDTALSNIVGILNIAFGPKAIDAEDEQEFQRRWQFLISRAATGALERPREMPIASNYFA